MISSDWIHCQAGEAVGIYVSSSSCLSWFLSLFTCRFWRVRHTSDWLRCYEAVKMQPVQYDSGFYSSDSFSDGSMDHPPVMKCKSVNYIMNIWTEFLFRQLFMVLAWWNQTSFVMMWIRTDVMKAVLKMFIAAFLLVFKMQHFFNKKNRQCVDYYTKNVN